MLKVDNLSVYYGKIKPVESVSFSLKEGNILALIGSNGAGKTSILNAIMNLVKKSGKIEYFGTDISKLKTHQIARRGLYLVPEGRRIFSNLSVEENLAMGSFNNSENHSRNLDKIYSTFPILSHRKHQVAGSLSGGEQQVLAISRALMGEPKILMLDEPTLGLSPKNVDYLFKIILDLKKYITILLVEQNAHMALKISDVAHIIESGKIIMSGKSKELLESKSIQNSYFGI